MSGLEIEFVKRAFDSNWIAPAGPDLTSFEEEFSKYIGIENSLALTSGTAAIHLALKIIGVKEGDEVFSSTFTFCATANPIVYEGGAPVFIDSETKSWNMDPNLLCDELKKSAEKNRLPKAVIVAHIYGQSADMDPILDCCSKYDIPVIEDATEALGARYGDKLAGTLGKASAFSFNGNKIITTSGGGMLVSEDKKLIDEARHLSTQAKDQAPHYQHSQIGYNYRMSNILAAIGRGQLLVLEDRIEQKRSIYKKYQSHLGDVPGIDFMPEADYGFSTHWLTCITIDPDKFGADRRAIELRLAEENIESRPVWFPLHMQPVFSKCRSIGGKVSEELFRDGLCLPSGTSMTDEDIDLVSNIIKSTVRKT
jgi:pyridoxal phosphate-dependent aminotransferase EpsN